MVPFLNQQDAVTFILILFRVSGIFLSSPVFSSRNVNPRYKIIMSIATALVLFPTVTPLDRFPLSLAALAVYAAGQLLFGFFIGACATFMFSGVQMAGALMDVQIGFGMSAMLDPMSGEQTTVVSRWMNLLAIVVFLAIDGHHWLLLGIINSFKSVPLDRFILSPKFVEYFIRSFSDILNIAFHVAVPLMAAILLVDVIMGFISKIAPHMNILIIGFPFKIAMGLFIISVYIPHMMNVFYRYFDRLQAPLIRMFYF